MVSASSAQAVLIDFETFTAPTTITAGTNIMGLTFDQNISVAAAFDLFPGSSGNQGIAPGFGGFSGFFSQTVASLSIAAGDSGGDIDTVTLVGYDALDQIVDSDSFTANIGQVLSIVGSGIARFELQDVGTQIVFDNITFEFESDTIPEPAAIALFGLVLAGIGLARRRTGSSILT